MLDMFKGCTIWFMKIAKPGLDDQHVDFAEEVFLGEHRADDWTGLLL